MIGDLRKSLDELADLWPHLVTAVGARGVGQPSHKSRPPATLSVVSLVMEVGAAAREAADEFDHATRDTLANLAVVAARLAVEPDNDVLAWWAGSAADWAMRARLALGLAPSLPHHQFGAVCPLCRSSIATIREAGESWQVPAIGVTWVEHEFDSWQVHSVFCRSCGADWVRNSGLDQLVELLLANDPDAQLLVT